MIPMTIQPIVPLAFSVLYAFAFFGFELYSFPFIVMFIMALYLFYVYSYSVVYKHKVLSLNISEREQETVLRAKKFDLDLDNLITDGVTYNSMLQNLFTDKEKEEKLIVPIQILLVRQDDKEFYDKVLKIIEEMKIAEENQSKN
jgi:hypothetical protein